MVAEVNWLNLRENDWSRIRANDGSTSSWRDQRINCNWQIVFLNRNKNRPKNINCNRTAAIMLKQNVNQETQHRTAVADGNERV